MNWHGLAGWNAGPAAPTTRLDEFILDLPDYPVGHDEPLNFTPGIMQCWLDGGTVQAPIPLTALSSMLRI
jgi:hypothetical protein